jgi:DNA-binding response OmpR family regulator
MRDVWLYGSVRESTNDLGSALAELGYTPRYMGAGEPLVPAFPERSTTRLPTLAIVVVGPDDETSAELVARLAAAEEFDNVGLMVAARAEHLRRAPFVSAAHELLVHPCTLAELEARVARATRDVRAVDDGTVVRADPLELNLATYQVTNAGVPISFTYMEYELLKFLVTHPNRVFSREALLKRVWGYDYYGGARTVDVHIRRVRAKLGQEQAARVKTIRNVGYLFELAQMRSAAA